MSEKELIATWDNKYGVDWHILRPMVTKALRNKTGYLTVKVTHDGEQAQLFFEQITAGEKPFTPDDLDPETKTILKEIRDSEAKK